MGDGFGELAYVMLGVEMLVMYDRGAALQLVVAK